MAKFLAALLGCTLPSKGASPMLEGTIFSTLAGEKPSSDYKKEQRWKPVYCSLAATCLTGPLIEKPGGKVRLFSCLVEWCNSGKMPFISFGLEVLGELIKSIS
uniref:RasGEF domain family, member 1B n=1 Tax=Peromyscus maniculatus bairdii TaxID=230844 RepID=A0A8C8W5Q0_PERMB